MNFAPLDVPECYDLFPEANKLANLVLKKLGYLTSTEQHVASRRHMMEGIFSIAKPLSKISKEDVTNVNFHAEQSAQYGDVNPFRDLAQLQTEGVDIIKNLHEVKKTYNGLIKVCVDKSPEFMDLIWQVYRRTHQLKANYYTLESIINPPEISPIESEHMIPSPRTDSERIKSYQFNLRFTSDSPFLQVEPHRRLVEFDSAYFHETGRFAFATENGDIFQTIWDERQKEFPLFKLD